MEILNHIRILYKNYEIIQQENLHDGSSDLYGQIHYLPEKIILNAESTEEQKKATLMHELVHAMDDMYGIGLKEKQIEKLGSAIYMMVKDNAGMFRGSDNID